MRLEREDIQAYLTADEIVQSDHTTIASAAKRLCQRAKGSIEKAKTLFEWVRDEISHSNDANRTEVTCSALEVLESGTGACYAKSHLLAALLRAEGIPAGFCYQIFSEDHNHDAAHGLNGIFLDELEKWIRIDPRGNTSGCDQPAEFDLGSERARLAFPDLEFFDDVIYASPRQEIVSSLQKHEDRATLWKDLPRLSRK